LSQPVSAIEWTDADEHAAEAALRAPSGGDNGPAIRH
jgi:hypothetical protein